MIRYFYDPNAPQGAADLSNLVNALRSLHQTDLMPLRCRANLLWEGFEYSTDASIQAEWSGTGVTVTAEGTTMHDGNFDMKAVIDGTGNRTVTKTESIDIIAFTTLQVWIQCTAAASNIQFFIVDGSANESYWDIATHASVDTWEQESLTLDSPDSNNGSDAELDDVVSYGFKGLDASETYYIDNIDLICGLNVAVEASHPGSYYKTLYIGSTPLEVVRQSSPALVAPAANPRIDILCVDGSGVLTWVTGAEAGSPVPLWASLSSEKMPLCLVYCKVTMTSVLNYEDKDTDANQAYIYADCRPLYSHNPLTSSIQDADGDTKIQCEESADEDIVRIDTGGSQRVQIDSNGVTLEAGASINEFSTDTSLAGNSDDAVPTEKASKTYIDSRNNIGFFAYRNAAKTTISGWTNLVCDVEKYDYGSVYNTSSGKFTVPAGKGGLYHFGGACTHTSLNAGTAVLLSLYKNGSRHIDLFLRDVGNAGESMACGSVYLDLIATDFVELYVFQNEGNGESLSVGTSPAIKTYFQCQLVG